ncbi:MAG: type II toxin-antitoxin system HicB family antitoxin [Tannerella sp.]|jgi:predicted RNase H-like HicB family nuclease|nr:type II toxin-antitoxin system HicB family antitoxin [Tannerella sp.]
MEKILVNVGMTENNYSAHVIMGDGIAVATGKTFEELKRQMEEAVAFHLEGMNEDGDEIPAEFQSGYTLVYRFNPENLLQHYNGIFTNAALERLTGINQRQLQRYASGASKPRREQSQKIESALHHLGKELLAVEL